MYLDGIEQSLGVTMLLEVIANRLGKNKKFIRSDEYILLAEMDASTLKDRFRRVSLLNSEGD